MWSESDCRRSESEEEILSVIYQGKSLGHNNSSLIIDEYHFGKFKNMPDIELVINGNDTYKQFNLKLLYIFFANFSFQNNKQKLLLLWVNRKTLTAQLITQKHTEHFIVGHSI